MQLQAVKQILNRTPLKYLHRFYRAHRAQRSQSDECIILDRLVSQFPIPRSFVEFGFHPHEFNCVRLVKSFDGLLIDGDPENVLAANSVLPKNVQAIKQWIKLGNLSAIEEFARGKGELGILSIDVDGNDYWFLKALLPLRPALVVVEYNASLGLEPLTVPYDDNFERHAKHPSGWYHGASLSALSSLCESNGYALVEIASEGTNAFFMRRDIFGSDGLSAEAAYRENSIRNKWSKTTAAQQWDRIKGMPFVDVSS